MGRQNYVVAQRFPDYALVSNPAAMEVPSAFVTAAPGDVLIMWATGLGPTNPPGTEGLLPVNHPAVANPVTLRVGGKVVPVIGAAISDFAATYQVSFTVPNDAPEGDVPITLSVGGVNSPDGVLLRVAKK